jgi:hypothetical protein
MALEHFPTGSLIGPPPGLVQSYSRVGADGTATPAAEVAK